MWHVGKILRGDQDRTAAMISCQNPSITAAFFGLTQAARFLSEALEEGRAIEVDVEAGREPGPDGHLTLNGGAEIRIRVAPRAADVLLAELRRAEKGGQS